jgi:type II secretory pathway pseudopilin PulG
VQNRKGISLVGSLVAIGVFVFMLVILLPGFFRPRRPGMRLVCGTNLKGLSNGLNVYAFDYRDEYPIQGAGTHTWGTTTTGWDDPQKDWETSTGTLTVASSLYLLARKLTIAPHLPCDHTVKS